MDFQIIVKQRDGWVDQTNPKTAIENPKFDGTVKRGSATCPCCGYTTPVARVREQFKAKHGGLEDARLFAVVGLLPSTGGRQYRLPNERDIRIVRKAVTAAKELKTLNDSGLSSVPNESTTGYHTFVNRGPIYGMVKWGYYFLPRQALAIATLGRLTHEVGAQLAKGGNEDFAAAVQTKKKKKKKKKRGGGGRST